MNQRWKIGLALAILVFLLYASYAPYKFLIGTEPFRYITIYLVVIFLLLPLSFIISATRLKNTLGGNWKKAVAASLVVNLVSALFIFILYFLNSYFYARAVFTTNFNLLIEFAFTLAWLAIIFYLNAQIEIISVRKFFRSPKTRNIFLLANAPAGVIAFLPYILVIFSFIFEIF